MFLLLRFQRSNGNAGLRRSTVIPRQIRKRFATGSQNFTALMPDTFSRRQERVRRFTLEPGCLPVAKSQLLNPGSAITADHLKRWIANADISLCLEPCGLSRLKNGRIISIHLTLLSLATRITRLDRSSDGTTLRVY